MICPTCGHLLADKQLEFENKSDKIANDTKLSPKEKSELISKLLDELGFKKYCCRMRVMSYIREEKILVAST
jgi:DNA-directed RNA polymerase subunit N (RpoN/RPB10)